MSQSIGIKRYTVYYEWVLVVIARNVFQTTGEQAQGVSATVKYRGQLHHIASSFLCFSFVNMQQWETKYYCSLTLTQHISVVHKSVLDQRALTYNQIKFNIADNWFMVNLFYYPEQIL